jgi:hypothetical protein
MSGHKLREHPDVGRRVASLAHREVVRSRGRLESSTTVTGFSVSRCRVQALAAPIATCLSRDTCRVQAIRRSRPTRGVAAGGVPGLSGFACARPARGPWRAAVLPGRVSEGCAAAQLLLDGDHGRRGSRRGDWCRVALPSPHDQVRTRCDRDVIHQVGSFCATVGH